MPQNVKASANTTVAPLMKVWLCSLLPFLGSTANSIDLLILKVLISLHDQWVDCSITISSLTLNKLAHIKDDIQELSCWCELGFQL